MDPVKSCLTSCESSECILQEPLRLLFFREVVLDQSFFVFYEHVSKANRFPAFLFLGGSRFYGMFHNACP